jgi:threonine dehydrogenase-like Zn-dependent dehydrogenase
MVLDVSVPRVLLTRLLGRMSKGAYFGPTSPLRVVDLPDPPLPASDWVRVRNRLCGICGSDLHQPGALNCDGLLTHRFPLDAYREAFATAVDKRASRSVKVAFDLSVHAHR